MPLEMCKFHVRVKLLKMEIKIVDVNPFHANVLFLYPLNTLENLCWSLL